MRHSKTLFVALAATLALGPPGAFAVPPVVAESAGHIASLAPMLEKVVPAVVNVSAREYLTRSYYPRFGGPFGYPYSPEAARDPASQSLGSGVIVDSKNGYILTDYHVVERAGEITVTLQDGRRLRARLVGKDQETDLALLQISADHLTSIPFGDSDSLRVGDFVVAIGNPFGLGQSVTSGIVSALGRSGLGLEGYEDFIQTDASINPGNSGGALVNLKGDLVGLNAAILAPAGGNVGIGFAIPANMARGVLTQLVAQGTVRRGRIGIAVRSVTADMARSFGVDETHGAIVTQVQRGLGAARAGLRPGDVILAVNGRSVRDAIDLRNRVSLSPIGSKVDLDVWRDGKRLEIEAAVAPIPARYAKN
jgi:Do/DeqQ family serine protease